MTSTNAINDVQNYNFGSDPDHWFQWNGPATMQFTAGIVDKDLYFAMRNVNLSNYIVQVRVQAGTLKVLQVSIKGNVNCIYSFSFNETTGYPGFTHAFQWGALLQSGYKGAGGTNGQVFYYQVDFDNTNIDMPYTYPPKPH